MPPSVSMQSLRTGRLGFRQRARTARLGPVSPARALAMRADCQVAAEMSAAAADAALTVKNLRVSLGEQGKQVLKGADLVARRGSFHMLLGPNGCGKSTLLRTLGALIEPQSGQVSVEQPTAFVFQNPDHQVIMPTVRADVAFTLGRYDLDPEQVASRVAEALAAVNLESVADSPTRNLSGGQKQRVAIASALVDCPRVLLLDELTTYLDETDQRTVLEAVAGLVKGPSAVTAIWVTHRLEELRYADTASYMRNGVIEVTGSPAKIIEHLRGMGAAI